MKINGEDIFTDYIPGKTEYDPITIQRFLPDGSRATIGYIEPDFSNGEGGPIIYLSTDIHGQEMFPPTTDDYTLGKLFEEYAEKLERSEKSLLKERKAELDQIREQNKDREEEIER